LHAVATLYNYQGDDKVQKVQNAGMDFLKNASIHKELKLHPIHAVSPKIMCFLLHLKPKQGKKSKCLNTILAMHITPSIIPPSTNLAQPKMSKPVV
jgi:hypothetical protein